MITQATRSQNIVINMVWGTRGPGSLGYAMPLVISMVNKQIQFSQMIIQAAGPQNIVLNMVWKTRGPGAFGIYNSPYILIGKQRDPILPNNNQGHRAPEHSDEYGLWGPGSGGLWDMQCFCIVNDKQTNPILPNDNPARQVPEYSN